MFNASPTLSVVFAESTTPDVLIPTPLLKLWAYGVDGIVVGVGRDSSDRVKLPGNTIYYVSASGADGNLGTQASPWKTLQRAMNYISTSVDTAGYVAEVSIGAGSFAPVILKPFVGGGFVYFNGASVSTTSIVASADTVCVNGGLNESGASYFFNNLTLNGSGYTFSSGVSVACLWVDGINVFYGADATNLSANGTFAFIGPGGTSIPMVAVFSQGNLSDSYFGAPTVTVSGGGANFMNITSLS